MGKRIQFNKIEFTNNKDEIDDFFEDLQRNWEYKAKRLQARRWRKIKHQEV